MRKAHKRGTRELLTPCIVDIAITSKFQQPTSRELQLTKFQNLSHVRWRLSRGAGIGARTFQSAATSNVRQALAVECVAVVRALRRTGKSALRPRSIGAPSSTNRFVAAAQRTNGIWDSSVW